MLKVSLIFVFIVIGFACFVLLRIHRRTNTLHEQIKETQSYQSRTRLQISNLTVHGGSGRNRSVLFLHNSYYHFYYLAKELRRRGWDAVSVSYEDPINGPHANYFHGEDVNLWSPDPDVFRQNIEELFADAVRRFRLLHFAGDGLMSFFPENWMGKDPSDIIRWKKHGNKVAYTISGCKSCVSQSSYAAWSALDNGKAACDRCMWQTRPDICSDEANLSWGREVAKYCDLVFAETAAPLDLLNSARTIITPVTMCLDPLIWDIDMNIPRELMIPKENKEVLVFHSVGNYRTRTKQDGDNIKGTRAVMAAVEQLRSENLPVRLIFRTDARNFELRYVQAQSDIVVDQLNLGRYGAISREGMMLGKAVICYINRAGKHVDDQMEWLDELPVVSATEETVYEVLKMLVLDADKRASIGRKSREYALKWHSSESCAKRYERIYDKLIVSS